MAQSNTERGKPDGDFSQEAVPAGARKGFWSMFVVMMGFTFFSASMSVGAKLGNGLDLTNFIWAVVIGGIILGAYTGGLAYVGCDTGLTLDLLAQRSFGTAGSKLASVLIAFTQIGWFGVGVAMFAIPAAELLQVSPVILVAIAGLCMTASAYFGIKALTIVSAISVPLIAVLGIYSMTLSTLEGGGLNAIFSRSTQGVTLLAGVGLVIGSFVSGGTATPNFVRFARNNTVAVTTTVIAFFLGNSLMFAFGAVGGAFTGKDDIFYVMIAQGLALPALIVLGANIWTTNNNALYTGGLGLTNITGMGQRPMTLVSGVVGTVAAIWLYNNFVGWLNFLNATLPPVGAIVMLDYVLHRADYRAKAAPAHKVHWGAVAGVAAGAAVGNFVTIGIASINAMAVACICYLAADKLVYQKNKEGTRMLIKGVHIENAAETSDIRVTGGKFEEIAPSLVPNPEEEVIDCTGKLVLPPFIESHVHLDTCLTAGEPVWNQSGTLFEGIQCWALRKESLTKQDVKDRVRRAVRMQAQNGVQFVRTHVDVTDPKLTAMEALLELREELSGTMDIQVVAFPQEGIDSYPNGRQLMEDAVKMGADVVGAIPHFEFTREYAVETVNFAVKLAEKYDKLVDVHCDEIDDEQSRGLEVLAARAYESGLKDRVTASHTTAMHSYNNAYVTKLMRLLKLSEINFVANPLVNTHLQGRMDTYPKRRGITRVKELLAEGINVSFGHDDIFDPWYPLGTGNMRDVVFMGLHVCQMMGYQEIMDSYRLISTNAARTLHLGEGYGIQPGNPASFLVLDADNFYNALNQKSEVLYSFKNGRLIAQAAPARREVLF